MDSGATSHMCKERGTFVDYTEVTTARNVLCANNSAHLKVLGHGTVTLRVWKGNT